MLVHPETWLGGKLWFAVLGTCANFQPFALNEVKVQLLNIALGLVGEQILN